MEDFSLAFVNSAITIFRIGLFEVVHDGRGPKRPSLTKICYTYPTMMKLGTFIP